MKQLTLTLILLTGLLTACLTPAVTPVTEREGDTVTATVAATEPFDLVSLVLSTDTMPGLTRAEVPDERCSPVNVEGLIPTVTCDLGDFSAGQSASVVVRTEQEVFCLSGGYLSESPLSYRAVPCEVSKGR